jgi:hypothetical protein
MAEMLDFEWIWTRIGQGSPRSASRSLAFFILSTNWRSPNSPHPPHALFRNQLWSWKEKGEGKTKTKTRKQKTTQHLQKKALSNLMFIRETVHSSVVNNLGFIIAASYESKSWWPRRKLCLCRKKAQPMLLLSTKIATKLLLPAEMVNKIKAARVFPTSQSLLF